jgi:hypothetical protein
MLAKEEGKEENEDSDHMVNDCEHYIIPHPKYNTHMHVDEHA